MHVKRWTLINALEFARDEYKRCAVEEYRQSRQLDPECTQLGHQRVGDQFERQARECDKLALQFQQIDRIELED